MKLKQTKYKFKDRIVMMLLKEAGCTYKDIAKHYEVPVIEIIRFMQPPTFVETIVKNRADSKCELCGNPAKTGQLHHLSYDFSTYNYPSNIQFVCNMCHNKVSQSALNKRIDEDILDSANIIIMTLRAFLYSNHPVNLFWNSFINNSYKNISESLLRSGNGIPTSPIIQNVKLIETQHSKTDITDLTFKTIEQFNNYMAKDGNFKESILDAILEWEYNYRIKVAAGLCKYHNKPVLEAYYHEVIAKQ